MKLPPIGSIGMRRRLIVLLAVAMLPLAATFVADIWTDHIQTIATARNGVYAEAKWSAATESRVFDETRVLLETLALVPVVDPSGGAACAAFIGQVKRENSLYNTIGVVDAAGTITCHNSLKTQQQLSDAALRGRMMVPGAPRFMIGNFVIGLVSGKPTVIAASSFPTVGDEFSGAVFASLNLDKLTREIEIVSGSGRRSVVLLEANSDRVLVHYPPLNGVPFGAPFPNHPLLEAVHGAREGGTTEARGIDGVERIYGFAPLPGAEGIILAVGKDRNAIMAPVRQRLFLSCARLLTVILAAASFVWWLSERTQLRPIRQLMDAASRLGAGDYEACVKLDPWQAPEFRQLGRILGALSQKLLLGRDAEAIVAASETKFRILAENTADLITCSDSTGRRIFVSPASREMLGYEPEELMGMRPQDLAHPADVTIVDAMMAEVGAGRSVTGIRYRVAHRQGGFRWAEIAGKPLEGGAGAVFVMRDVTSRKLMETELAEASRRLKLLASTDGLTGLANRRALDTQLETEFARAIRGHTNLSFLLIDVDSFKAFNDTYGHQVGDDCLRRLAKTLRDSLRRPGDLTARYGGEELAAILPATNALGAFERAEVVRRAVRDLAIPHSGSNHGFVTISVGVATLVAGSELLDIAGLIRTADRALYEAKAKGRDQVVVGIATPVSSQAPG